MCEVHGSAPLGRCIPRGAGRRAPEAEPESVAAEGAENSRAGDWKGLRRGHLALASRAPVSDALCDSAAAACGATGRSSPESSRSVSLSPTSTAPRGPGTSGTGRGAALGLTAKRRSRAAAMRSASCSSSASAIAPRRSERRPTPRALQEPVHDLDRRRALAQHRERVEQPLHRVARARRARADPRLGPTPIALVVEHQARSRRARAPRRSITPRDQRLARPEREGERVLAAHARQRAAQAAHAGRLVAARARRSAASSLALAACRRAGRARARAPRRPAAAGAAPGRRSRSTPSADARACRARAPPDRARRRRPAPRSAPRRARARVRGSSDSRSARARSSEL